ncbi:MAG: DUF29 domain-containing protein [Candidatus Thiosymbion ectosymbiont of Robbea hypermnestra]|nr:DUF29 domain-containing protein [Candidatus Thiosymbion ectosymbiont of Robbea hypermnestra]
MITSKYEQDFYAWTQEQAGFLRARRYSELDSDHLLEELEDMGARERRELINRLKVLLAHLLKWRFQPQRQSRSWAATIKEQRLSVQDLLDDNPSLRGVLDSQITKAYRLARLVAVKETDLDEATFPETCPFSRDEISDENYLPPRIEHSRAQ